MNDHTSTFEKLFPGFIWKFKGGEKEVFLTFDDGPIEGVTPWVLETLKTFKVKATFFCLGENIVKNPIILKQIISEGHSVGNHTYSHLDSWKTSDEEYLQNISKCAQYIPSNLFRPPFGKVKTSLIRSNSFFSKLRVIMWDVMSGDFDENISTEQCLENVLSKVKPGSIVLFHDSKKAEAKLKKVLPMVINKLQLQGYTFKAIDSLESDERLVFKSV